jgi:glycosyltransferase involved in cell wall biosynthesis
LEDAGAKVIIVPMMQLRSRLSPGYLGAYLTKFWPTVWRLGRIIRQENAALVHTNSLYVLYGAWAAVIARRPHIWHVREIPEGVPRLVLALMAVLTSKRVIAMSKAVASIFPSLRRVVAVPDGIDLNEFHPYISGIGVRSELQIASDRPLVTFVGRLDPWKGVDIFLKAAARVTEVRKDVEFLVCGGELPGYERYAESLRSIASGIGGRVHLAGWRYCPSDIPEVMAASDILVHTSVKPEPFGLVLLEAMATGRPVIAAEGGGVGEVVGADTAVLVPPGEPDRLAEAILALLSDECRRKQMGRAGRLRAEAMFDISNYARHIESLYDRVLSADLA